MILRICVSRTRFFSLLSFTSIVDTPLKSGGFEQIFRLNSLEALCGALHSAAWHDLDREPWNAAAQFSELIAPKSWVQTAVSQTDCVAQSSSETKKFSSVFWRISWGCRFVCVLLRLLILNFHAEKKEHDTSSSRHAASGNFGGCGGYGGHESRDFVIAT